MHRTAALQQMLCLPLLSLQILSCHSVTCVLPLSSVLLYYIGCPTPLVIYRKNIPILCFFLFLFLPLAIHHEQFHHQQFFFPSIILNLLPSSRALFLFTFFPMNTDTHNSSLLLWQGSIVTSTSFMIHRDQRYWDVPDEFCPEQWLDKEGKFVTKKEGFLPFGSGTILLLGSPQRWVLS